MDNLRALSRGAQIMLIGGVLLLISLFLPWQDFGDGTLGEPTYVIANAEL